MSQGERLAAFINENHQTERSFALHLGYKHPSIIYAVLKGRNISPILMGKIIEKYPELNPNWLLKGEFPKLLTDGLKFHIVETVEDDPKIYKHSCPECLKKDEEIIALKEDRDKLKDEIIRLLKEASGSNKTSSG